MLKATEPRLAIRGGIVPPPFYTAFKPCQSLKRTPSFLEREYKVFGTAAFKERRKYGTMT